MRISNHFTTLILLIICGLFLCPGVVGDSNQYGVMHLSIEEIEARAAELQSLSSASQIAAFGARSTLPESVDLLPLLAYDPETRSQRSCGNCWVWAGTGAISISQNAQTGVYDELSIQYTNSLLNNGGTTGPFACYGGNSHHLATFYMDEGNKRLIPVRNTNAEYADGNGGQPGGYEGGYKTNMPAENIVKTPCYSFTNMYAHAHDFTQPQGDVIDEMKRVLERKYPIVFGYFLPNEEAWEIFRTFWDLEAEDALFQIDGWDGIEHEDGSGHDVLIVGYDATDQDSANHYWVLLNSWGAPENRPNGTFRIPMYINYQTKAPNVEALSFDASIIVTEWMTKCVTTEEAQIVPETSATLNGVLTNPDLETVDLYFKYWEYGTPEEIAEIINADESPMDVSGPFSATLTIDSGDVELDTEYTFRACAYDICAANTYDFTITGYPRPETEVNPDRSKGGYGYIWTSETELVITRSGVYTFADADYGDFGIYVDAPNVEIRGPITITGSTSRSSNLVEYSENVDAFDLSRGRNTKIGVSGNPNVLQTLDLYNVTIPLNGRSGETLIGVRGARNVTDSTITINGQRRTTATGIQELFGTFDRSEINISGNDDSILTGIESLYGQVSGGSISIHVPTGSEGFEIIGVNTVALGAGISGGDFVLIGRGSGLAIGVRNLHGSITGATSFELYASEVIGIETVDGQNARVSGGTFDLSGNFAAGITSLNDGVISAGTFDVHGYSEAYGIGIILNARVTGGTFNTFGDDAVGIFSLNGGVVSNGAFNVHGYSSGYGINYLSNGTRVQGGMFDIHGGTVAVGTSWLNNAVIEQGLFTVYSPEGKAIGIRQMADRSSMQGGEFWVMVPQSGIQAIGIWDTSGRPDSGEITVWAPTRDKVRAIATWQLSGGEFVDPYSFDDYRGNPHKGKAILYPNANTWTIREIYETTSYIRIAHVEPSEGAWINPEGLIPKDRPRWVQVSFGPLPGFDLTSVFVNNNELPETELERGITSPLRTNRNYNIATETVRNQIHIDDKSFRAIKVNGKTVPDNAKVVKDKAPLKVTFEATALQTEGTTGEIRWKWDFGNGKPKEDCDKFENGVCEVSTEYTRPGTYSVLVTATDSTGSATIRKTGYVVVNDFNAANSCRTSGC